MLQRLLADGVVALHFAFILFVGAGGLLALRWPRVAWAHAIALAWGLWILASGATCPLTPLENSLRHAAGEGGYAGGFIDHYITPVIYPAGLTRGHQWALAVLLIGVNGVCYVAVWRRAQRARRRLA
jgi:hypothetical protein